MLYSFLSFTMIALFISYMFINIGELGNGSPGLMILAISAIIGLLLTGIQLFFAKKIYINKSFLVLVLFFTYFIFRIVIDTQEISILKSSTIATTGGIILYYIFGVIVGNFFITIKDELIRSKQLEKFFIVIFFLSLVIFTYFFLTLFIELMAHKRADVFLVSSGDRELNYQRIGMFLFMSFAILLFYYQLFYNITLKKRTFFYNTLRIISFGNILLLLVLSLFFSQLIGSNNTLIDLAVLLISFTLMTITLTRHNILLFSKYTFTFNNLFTGKITKMLYSRILVGLIILFILMILIINYFDIDIYKFRILGYGTEGIRSVDTRLALWKYFSIQLDYSLFLGNMGVDTYTTGKGTYMHSLPASLITHLGLIGFILFFTYLYFAIKEKLYSSYSEGEYGRYVDNSILVYSLIVFMAIFIIASVGVFFTWVPIWFLMGMFFPIFTLNNKRNNKIAKKSNINSTK